MIMIRYVTLFIILLFKKLCKVFFFIFYIILIGDIMKFKLSNEAKTLIIAIIIPLAIGFFSFLLTREGIKAYNTTLIKPSFAPPAYLFGIVWTILYVLMGISSYLIYNTMVSGRSVCLIIYGLNLLLNFMWPIIFFNMEARLFAFIFIVFLDIVVIFMIICFHGIFKKAAYLQIPYLIWLIYATILNLSVYFLNR